jgi:hypothetical protein
MSDPSQSKRVCPACGSDNGANAERCATCGFDLSEDPALTHVEADRRVELTRFEVERGDEAELACGLLRANGIACELSSTLLPGLPADLIIWVDAQDAKPASALLEDAKRGAQGEEDDEAG